MNMQGDLCFIQQILIILIQFGNWREQAYQTTEIKIRKIFKTFYHENKQLQFFVFIFLRQNIACKRQR
jgi:hypothetical protein